MSDADCSPSFLAPFPADRFFAEHWEREPLLVPRQNPAYFADSVRIDELDRLVTATRIPASNLNLARGDTPLPLSAYTFDNAYVDQHRMLALHQQGATIILRSIEQWSPALNRLRIAAEEFFRFAAQVNVYLTPACEKSTPPHWDTHDLMILQVAGSKRWRLFRGQRTLPLADERFRIDDDYVSPETEEVVLHAGDTLYLPRGVIHEPIAESYSAHVSIGVLVPRYYDLVAVALQLLAAREGSPLRRGVPREYLGGPLPAGFDAVRELLDSAVLDEAAVVLRRRTADNRALDLRGRLREISEGPTRDRAALYVQRFGTTIQTSNTGTGLRVVVGEQAIDLPLALKDAVDYINTHVSFTAADLPGSDENEERYALCVALTQIGALRVEDGGTRR